jgi:hypothetical protein
MARGYPSGAHMNASSFLSNMRLTRSKLAIENISKLVTNMFVLFCCNNERRGKRERGRGLGSERVKSGRREAGGNADKRVREESHREEGNNRKIEVKGK